MDRFIESGGSATPPSTPGAASVKYPTQGNPLTATPASKPGEYWFHMITESLRAIIVAAGNTPVYNNLNLLKDSIIALVTSTMAATVRGTSLGVITLSGTSQEWTSIPAGVERVEIWGRSVSLNGADDFAIQLGNATSYVSSGYNGQARQSGSNTWSTQAILSQSISAAAAFSLAAVLTKEPSTNIWHITSHVARDDGTGDAVHLSNGRIDVTAALTRIKIKSVASASFDSGTAFAKYW
jgi:hypothetical protein